MFYINDGLSFNDVKNNSQKCFNLGNLDLYYIEQLKNKAVINYTPIIDKYSFRYINSKNYIIEDLKNLNNRVNNDKECNVHNRYLNNMYGERGLVDVTIKLKVS